MRVAYLGVLAASVVAVACAKGDDFGNSLAPVLAVPVDSGVSHAGASGQGNEKGGIGGVAPSGSGGRATGGAPSVAGSGGRGAGGKSSAGGAESGGNGGVAGGASGSSGAGGTGGKPSSDGSRAVPDAGDGGGEDPGTCVAGQKLCGGTCMAPAPHVGCGTTGCDPCTTTAPDHGYVTCVSGQCAFDCLSGYTRSNDTCMSATGGGSSGGSSGCAPSGCQCLPFAGSPCCTTAGKCSCSTVPGLCF
jgi:hypothetical protein